MTAGMANRHIVLPTIAIEADRLRFRRPVLMAGDKAVVCHCAAKQLNCCVLLLQGQLRKPSPMRRRRDHTALGNIRRLPLPPPEGQSAIVQ